MSKNIDTRILEIKSKIDKLEEIWLDCPALESAKLGPQIEALNNRLNDLIEIRSLQRKIDTIEIHIQNDIGVP